MGDPKMDPSNDVKLVKNRLFYMYNMILYQIILIKIK